MNARESIAYFKSIGWELRPSTMERQRWWLSIFGDDDGMHFRSLPDVWDFFKKIKVLDHFRQALSAQWTLDAIQRYDRYGPERREIERWARDEIEELPYFASEIADKTMSEAEGCSLPKQWRRAYKKIIEPLGALHYAVYGCILQRGVLAFSADDSASYGQMPAGSGRVGQGNASVGRKTSRRTRSRSEKRADCDIPDRDLASTVIADDATGS
jgi:hypothetical protein